jgi:lysophospholipase L1-like esterase
MLLRNLTATNNNWLKLSLRGVSSNRNGIGARVIVTSGGLAQTQQLLAGFAMVSGGGDLTFHFGLGSQSSAQRVEVIWPSGQRDILANVNANQTLIIQEGSSGGVPNDDTPPTISGVQSSSLSSASATISWNTDEAADTRVEYGLTTAYGNASPQDASLVTNHTAGLTGLAANTTYHYRVHSRDAAGNLATSGDFSFATNSQSILLDDSFSGPAIDTNKWNKGSNSGNQATIVNGALTLRSTSGQSGWIVTKSPYPGAYKTAKLKITQPNDDGDLGMTPTVKLAGTNATYSESNWYRFYVYRDGHAGNYLLFAQWKRNGSAGGLDVTNGLTLPGSFWLRLRTDATDIFFEYSPDNVNWITVYQEAFSLPGYTLSSNFYFEISGNNTPSNGDLRVDDFSLSEAAPSSDTQPPVISRVASGNITTSAATITWTTDEASDSQVEYGTTANYGFSSPLEVLPVTAHSVALANLSANTTYHYRVKSRDAASNLAQSADFTFTTAAVAPPPVISSVTATNITGTTAQINFTTNRNTTGSAEYDTRAHGVTRVMPLGDSITEGERSSNGAGYRSFLYDKLAALGARFDFVVILHFGTGIPDPDHEGHPGWTADEIYASLNSFLNQSQPKAVLLHIGTNDVTSGQGANTVYNEIAAIVDGIFQYDATVKLYLSTLIPRTDSKQSVNDNINGLLPGLVSARTNAGYRMFLVDNSAAFKANNNWSSQWMADIVHPNDAGYAVMAQKWYQAYTVTEYDFSVSDGVLATSHAITLTNLTPGTVYHFRARAKDSANLESASADFAFTTPGSSGPIFSDNFSGNSLDTNKWRKGTNSGNLSRVASDALELSSSGTQTAWIVSRNAYAARNTTVSLKITQPNDDGNLGMTPTYALSASNGIFNQATWYRFYVYRDFSSGPYRLYVQWKKNGAVDGLDVTGNAVLNGSFHMRLRCDDTRIYFEFSPDNQAWTAAYSEPFGLSGYTLNDAFYYELAAYRTSVKGVLKVDDFAIHATTSGPDTQAPVITQVASGNIATTSATITWTTDELSDSQVEYGITTSYGNSSPLNATQVTAHNVPLTNLTASTSYYYRVKSKDAAGNLATSNDFTFTTGAAGGSTLLIDNFNTGSLDLNKWTKGSNSGNQAAVANQALELRSSGTQTAWVVTKQKYAARNTTVTVKIVQPNEDGDLGMSPTVQTSSSNGIFNQANWYRFYVYRDAGSGPYGLYVQWSKNGTVDGLDVAGNFTITGTVYLRLRFDDTRIYFEASLDGQVWTNTYDEVFALPGYTLNTTFNYELAAYWTEANGTLRVDDFNISTVSPAPAKHGEEAIAEAEQPTAFALSQNYPNPFHFNTHVRVALPEEAQVHAVIFDATGREVQQLYHGQMPTGYRVVNWDGTNAAGRQVSSGVYFLRVVFKAPQGRQEILTRQLRLTR